MLSVNERSELVNDRRHVWHDPDAAPHEIVSEGRFGGRRVSVSPRARGTLWALLWVTLGIIILGMVLIFGAIMVGVAVDDEPMIIALSEQEEAGVRGLATTIADRGRQGDYAAVLALAGPSKALDSEELASDIEAAFGGSPIKDWALDFDNVQVFRDVETDDRIVVFRLILTTTDGEETVTNPFYATAQKGSWRLTSIKGRDVKEELY